MNDSISEPEVHDTPGPHLSFAADEFALAASLEDSFTDTKRLRHDGWDGPRKATFCRTLAETGVVTEACRACGMSAKAAYALRQRDHVFALAWEAALSMARERLADELLARSMKGSVEQIMNNHGAIVGERHSYDNKLAMAVLRRLDRRAELGATFKTPPLWALPDAPAAVSGDWQLLLDAMSEDRSEDAALLLTPIPAKGNEGNDPPCEGDDEDSDSLDAPYRPRRVWQCWQTDEWRTDFPPPDGFAGDEKGKWEDSSGYSRSLTDEEMAALVAGGLAEPGPDEGTAISIDDDAADRDAFFAALRADAPQAERNSHSRGAAADAEDAETKESL